ncbi:MAG: trans-aconitate 2-methyltransferase [Acidimicrobiia bacterium]
MAESASDPHGLHDWHSADYVADWIGNDRTNDADRRPLLRQVAKFCAFDPDAKVRVLDVGGGYGMLSGEILDEWPNAHVVLHDFSAPMFDHARQRLARFEDRLSFHQGDLRDSAWVDGLDGPFDAVVSSLAIHNVREPAAIKQIYADIFPLVASGGSFLNIDIIGPAGRLTMKSYGRRSNKPYERRPRDPMAPTLANQMQWLLDIGYDEADCLARVDWQTVLAGFRA